MPGEAPILSHAYAQVGKHAVAAAYWRDSMANTDKWDEAATDLLDVAYGGGVLFAVGLLGWQLFQWLRTGHWYTFSFADGITFFGFNLSGINSLSTPSAATNPVQWFLGTPLFVTLPAILIGIAHAFRAAVLRRKQREP
jgi:hypothetical protein